MSLIRALGYVGFTASRLDAWRHFATEVLGLQLGEALEDGSLVLRADSYKRRVFLHRGDDDDLRYTGWETSNADTLEDVRARLQAQGVAFWEGGAELAKERAVLELIQFRDADGNAVEVFYGATEVNHDPFRSPVGGGSFVTGPQGLGHVVYAASDYEAQVQFYREKLDFKISDYNDLHVPGLPHAGHLTFFHVNRRHHSLALGNFPVGRRFNHLMLEVANLDDVGLAYERAKKAGAHILLDLGSHTNDHVFSFYVLTPSGWAVEIGWGGVRIDDEIWHVTHHPKPSIWGHAFNPPPRPRTDDAQPSVSST
ncbi:VOC family protein [Burkholderia gladioli]|uniref:VOC family protein n=1 Tax=Burkholderia gladioli TaxID=28095 RepID=UPI00163E64DA|nr:VOC family protein [Burkholderia gladioli]MDN7754859.1 VOC family protein [Burkholderia gladioli]